MAPSMKLPISPPKQTQPVHIHSIFFLFRFSVWLASLLPQTSGLYLNCGGDISDERGVIQSPNFPDPFPDPISCTWILRAPPGKRIHVRFTQYFLREAFFLAEFHTYTSPTIFTGRNDLGPVDFREHIRSVVGHKPVLSMEFRSWGKKNIHMRVEEFLTDVYGFNLTYEMEDVAEPLVNDTCSVSGCSFLGHCYVSGDWREYYCQCFPGYHGQQCQYGPHCDPGTGRNMCLNGGSCRYFYGSYVNMCECPPGFTGVQCETAVTNDARVDTTDKECSDLRCSQQCHRQSGTNRVSCSCERGFRLAADNVTCQPRELHRVTVDLYTADTYYTEVDALSQSYRARALRQLNLLLEIYKLPAADRFGIERFRALSNKANQRCLRFHFYTDRSNDQRIRRMLYLIGLRGRLFNLTLNHSHILVHITPELRHLGVENYEGRAAPEGSFSNLVCRAKGSNLLQFRWYKDGCAVNTSLTTRNLWTTRIEERDEDEHHTSMSILNINDITIYDQGVFTCEVEDFGEVQTRDVTLNVVTSPTIIITPRAANVRRGEPVSFRCFSPDERLRQFSYRWKKNGVFLQPHKDVETEEDVQPRGKRLTIPRAQHSANYTCVVTSHVISASATVPMFVTDTRKKCEPSRARGIDWTPAVHGGTDVQKCPNPMHGLASRACGCSEANCTWSAPNFARCQTAAFITVFDKMERLRLGYQGKQTLTDILAELLSLVRAIPPGDVIAGDVTLASRMMLSGMTTAVNIPDLLLQPSAPTMNPELPLELLSLLLHLSSKATEEERAEQKIMARALLTMEIISELMESCIPELGNKPFRDAVFVAEEKVHRNYVLANDPSKNNNPRLPRSVPSYDHLNSSLLDSRKENTNRSHGYSRGEALEHSAPPGTPSKLKSSYLGRAPISELLQHNVHPTNSEANGSKENLLQTQGLDILSEKGQEALIGTKTKPNEAVYKVKEGVEEKSKKSELEVSVVAKNVQPSRPDEAGFMSQNVTKQTDLWKGADRLNASSIKWPKLHTDGQHYVPGETFQALEIVHRESLRLVQEPQLMNKHHQQTKWVPLTPLRSVLAIGGLWSSERYRVSLVFHHNRSTTALLGQNHTVCWALTADSFTLELHWHQSSCQVQHSGTNYTACLCALPVHVAVFIKAGNLPEQAGSGSSVGPLVLLVGCILALCGLSVLLFSYCLTCRSVTSTLHVLRLNMVLALTLLLLLCVMCLQGKQLELVCLTGRLLLQLMLLALYSVLLVDSMHMHMVIHSPSSPKALDHHRPWKFLTIAWAVPVLSAGSTAAASSRYGHSDTCHVWCWVEPTSWHFYPFLVPLLMLVVASVLISVKCAWTVRPWTDEWRYRARKKQLFRISKNGAILFLLVGVTWTGCYVKNDQGWGSEAAFVCLLVSLVMAMFASYCITDRAVSKEFFAIFRHRKSHLKKNCSSYSFRAFIMPEKIDEGALQGERPGTEEESIHRLCAERDNNRYTSAKKRELRFLLGSTSSSSKSSSEESDPLRDYSAMSGHPRPQRRQQSNPCRRHLYTGVEVIVHSSGGVGGGGRREEEGGGGGGGEKDEDDIKEEETPADVKTDSGISVEEEGESEHGSVGRVPDA